MALLRLLQGAASTLVTPIAQAYVGDRTAPGREGRTMNMFYTPMFLGMGLGPLQGGHLAEQFGRRAPFYAMALLAVLALAGVQESAFSAGRALGPTAAGPSTPWPASTPRCTSPERSGSSGPRRRSSFLPVPPLPEPSKPVLFPRDEAPDVRAVGEEHEWYQPGHQREHRRVHRVAPVPVE